MKRTITLLVLLFASSGCDKGQDAHDETHAREHVSDEAKRGRSAIVELTPEMLKNVEIRVEKVSRRAVSDALGLPAEVEPHPDRIAHITPLVASQVAEVKAKPGDRVEKGQVLALLKSVPLGEARANVAQAKAELDVAKDRLNRQEQLMDAGIGAQKSYVEAQGALKQARAALSAAQSRAHVYGGRGGSGATTLLRSPLAGTVVQRHATAGEVASPEQKLFVIADIDPVWIIGRAYERDLAQVRVGQSAKIRTKAFPDRVWEGAIAYVSPTLDERTRTAEVRVELPNPDGALRPGMFATLIPAATPSRDAGSVTTLAIPVGAVQREDGHSIAFVALGPDRFEKRRIVVGKQGADYVEVRDGLASGDTVVTHGSFILKSEAAKHELGGGHGH